MTTIVPIRMQRVPITDGLPDRRPLVVTGGGDVTGSRARVRELVSLAAAGTLET